MSRRLKKLLQTRVAACAALLLLLIALSSSSGRAQIPGGPPPPDGPPPQELNPEADWKEALNLSADQMQRIKETLQRSRPERQAINQRLGTARRALDQAIYADTVNEAEVERLTRELGEAQAAEVRLRATTELSIRRVLTPEQLNTFRTIRMQRMRDAQMRRRGDEGRPPRPLKDPQLQNGINAPTQGQRGGLPRRPRP